MNRKEQGIIRKDDSGSTAKAGSVSSGRSEFVRQIPVVCHQATVCTRKGMKIAT